MRYGIFYNSPKAQCSIYESGLMIYNALKQSSKFKLDYTEDRAVAAADFTIFNYHPYVNGWMNECINRFTGPTFGVVLEVGHHGDLMPNTAKIFDKYLIIDPTIKDNGTVFGFGRPLEPSIVTYSYFPKIYPTVGSFGFATIGKRWKDVIVLTQEDFDRALIKFNIPFATFVPNARYEIDKITDELKSIPLKKGIELEITHDYMEKNELISWCAQNTINVFPYYRDLAGLAAVTDQAISAHRPILTTNNPTFRHINKYITPYPDISLKDAIEKNYDGVLQMAKDWSQENFYKKFEGILDICFM